MQEAIACHRMGDTAFIQNHKKMLYLQHLSRPRYDPTDFSRFNLIVRVCWKYGSKRFAKANSFSGRIATPSAKSD